MSASPTDWLYALRSGLGGLTAGVITIAACSAFLLGAGTPGPWRTHAEGPQVEKLTGPPQVQTAAAAHPVRAAADTGRRSHSERVTPIRPHAVRAPGRTTVPAAALPVRGSTQPRERTPRPVSAPQTTVAAGATDTDKASTVPAETPTFPLPAPPTLPEQTVPSVTVPAIPVGPVTTPSVTTPSVTVPSIGVPSLP